MTDAKLVELAEEMRGDLAQLPWARRDGDGRACRVCQATMDPVALVGIALERCTPHGIWFDANELEAVLSRAGRLDDRHTSTRAEPVIDAPRARDIDDVDLHRTGDKLGAFVFGILGAMLRHHRGVMRAL